MSEQNCTMTRCERCEFAATVQVEVFGQQENLCIACAPNVLLDSYLKEFWRDGRDWQDAYEMALAAKTEKMREIHENRADSNGYVNFKHGSGGKWDGRAMYRSWYA